MTALLSGRPGSQSRLGSGILAGASLLTSDQPAPVRVKSYTHLIPDAQAPITADAAGTFTVTSISDASEAIAGASAGSFAITSAATAQAADAAAAAGSFAITSAATAAALDAAASAAQFLLTSASAASAIDAATAAGQIPFTGSADATAPLNADAVGNIAVMSASDAAEAIAADAAGLIVMVGGYEEPAIPDYPTVTGIMWVPGWYDRWQARMAKRRAARAERIHQERYAVAITEIRIVAHATATTESAADAAGQIRIVGSSGAMMGSNPADDEEMLLLTMLMERLAA